MDQRFSFRVNVLYVFKQPSGCCSFVNISTMAKTFVGPQLRQLRRERHQTQAEMAEVLSISAGYMNL
jgi:hypothetical protein